MRSILKQLIALSLLALIAPFRANALGLGDIKLNSYLNQPLNARITMLPGHIGSLDQVRVRLASPAAFEQAGIERLPVLNHIKFKLVEGKAGKPQVKLSSDEPIKEPFLDFIVQVTWPNGRISREYTVLLDPPTTTAEHAPPVQPAATASAATRSAPQQTTARPRAATRLSAPAQGAGGPATASPSLDQAKLTKDSYGRTQRSDTLWSIAKTVRPDDSVSVQQVMLALVKKNPQAFYKGNVNTLKAGYILRLPGKSLISQVSQVAAVHKVQRQYHQWQQIKQGRLLADSTNAPAAQGAGQGSAEGAQGKAATHAGKTGAASGTASGDKGKTADEARLTLLPASADKAVVGGAATATGTKQGQAGGALQKQLDSLKQDQDKQIDALRNQVNELNQQVTSMKRLLSLKDGTLSTLQQKLGTHQGGPAAVQVTPKPAQAPKAKIPAKPRVHQAAQPKPHPAAPAVHAPHKAAPPPAPARGDSGLLADPKVLGLGGVVVLLLSALSWLSVRRRRMNAESLTPEAAVAEEDTAGQSQEAAPEQTDHPGEQQYLPTGGDLLEAEINEIDPLAEADVYMAYRRYQQAEDLLRSAIEQEPHRHELQLKLAEVFAAAGNTQAFLAEAQNLHNALAGQDSPIWNKVVEMGRSIQPDHPLFMGEADGQTVTAQMSGVTDAAGEDAIAEAVAPEAPPASDDGTEQAVPPADASSLDDLTVASGASGDGKTSDLDALPDLEPEPAAESADHQSEDKDNSIEFEAGLDQAGPAVDQPGPAAEAGGPQGNEIEFDMSAEDRPAKPAAGLPDTDPLAEDVLQAQNDISALDDEDKAGGDALTLADDGLDAPVDDGDTPPLVEPQAEDSAVQETAPAPSGEAKEVPAHDLDFDIELDKIAGRDQDFDNFFEELESTGAGEQDGETDELGGQQDMGTKLDLAKAFIEMGDQEGAKEILQEVVDLGDEDQKQEARGLLQQLQV